MWRTYLRQYRIGGLWQDQSGLQPGWAFRAAAITAILVFVVPLAVLAILALAVGVCVFVVLAAIAAVIQVLSAAMAGLLGQRSDGRVNVRVIPHDD